MSEQKETVFTCVEVAKQLNVTKQTVWKWIRTGKLRAIKINLRDYGIPESRLDKFIKDWLEA